MHPTVNFVFAKVLKSVKAEEVREQAKRDRLLRAISVDFLIRLLNTGDVDCPLHSQDFSAQSVALALLTTFCDLPRLRQHPAFRASLNRLCSMNLRLKNMIFACSEYVSGVADCLVSLTAECPSIAFVESGSFEKILVGLHEIISRGHGELEQKYTTICMSVMVKEQNVTRDTFSKFINNLLRDRSDDISFLYRKLEFLVNLTDKLPVYFLIFIF
ncbi:hypothetical protein ACOME3_003918 [Neoechinorhynchus agilis]